MKNKVYIATTILVILAGLVWFFGFFPFARINDEYILYREYSNRVSALEMFEQQNRRAMGEGELTPAIINDIQVLVLEGIITDTVFRQYIETHSFLAHVANKAQSIVSSTLGDADPDVLPQATEQLYGWSVEEFSENVLYPQALRNELAVAIEKDGTPFEEFARTQLTNADVQLYVVPWRWENGELVER